MRKTKWAAMALIAVFAVIQLIRPERTNPAVDEGKTIQASTKVPADVAAILDRSCADCHSSMTRWPWYSNIVPVSWYLASEVKKGRKELSFSEWGSYSTRRTARKLQEICEQLEKAEMPTRAYLLLHPSAKLSDADRRTVCEWAKQERARVVAGQAGGGR